MWYTLVGNLQDSMWRSPQIRRCIMLPETSGAGSCSRRRMGCCGFSVAGAYKDLTTSRGNFLCTGATPHCNALQQSPGEKANSSPLFSQISPVLWAKDSEPAPCQLIGLLCLSRRETKVCVTCKGMAGYVGELSAEVLLCWSHKPGSYLSFRSGRLGRARIRVLDHQDG